jgi:hypothetical protein
MEDLYGRTTLNKSLASPDSGGKYGVRSAFGRLTPVPDTAPAAAATVLGGGAGANGRPLLNGRPAFVPMTGRLTPNESGVGRASGRQKQQAGPQSSCASGGGGGLLNISSHNSSKLSSTTSGATKTTNDSLGAVGHHDLNSTQVGIVGRFCFRDLCDKVCVFRTLQYRILYRYGRDGRLAFSGSEGNQLSYRTDTVRYRTVKWGNTVIGISSPH